MRPTSWLSRLTRGTGVFGSVPEMFTIGIGSSRTHSASAGVFERRDDPVAAPAAQIEHRQRQRLRRRDVRPRAVVIGGVPQHAVDEHLLVGAPRKGQRNFFGSFVGMLY